MSSPDDDRSGIARIAIVAFLVALALQAVLVVQFDGTPLDDTLISDARSYDRLARTIAADGIGSIGVFHQSPLYPAMLSWTYRDVSSRAPSADPSGAALWLQAVLHALAIALLVPIAAGASGSRRAGALAGCIGLLFAPLPFYALLRLPSTLALATQGAALLATLRAARRPTVARAALAGALCGIAALARAEFLLFVPIAAVAAAGRGPVRERVVRAGTTALVAALCVAPATLHNARRGDLVPIASSAGENLYAGNQPSGDGGHTAIHPRAGDLDSSRRLARAVAEADAGRELRPSEISRYWAGRAARAALDDPAGWIALLGRKALRIVDLGDRTDIYSMALARDTAAPALHAAVVPVGAVLALAAVGLGWAIVGRPRRARPVIAFVAMHAVVLLVFFVNARLRLPLLYGAVVLAGIGADRLVAAWADRRRVALAGVAVVLVAAAASVVATAPSDRDRVRLAAIHSTRGELDEALAVLAPAIGRDSPDPLACDQAGYVEEKAGRIGNAIAHYRAAIRAGMPEGREASTRSRLARALERSGDRDGATREHDLAVGSPDADAGTLYERGRFLARLGRRDAAARDFRRAIELDPGWAPPRDALRSLGG